MDAFAELEGAEHHAERRERQAEQQAGRPRPAAPGDGAHHPAEQADQREGPKARGALAGGLLTLAPAALDPDQKTDAERQRHALEELRQLHGRGQRQPYCRSSERICWMRVRSARDSRKLASLS